jgi:hypothetical protein
LPKGEETSYRENFAGIIRTLQAYEQVNLAVESSQAKAEAEQLMVGEVMAARHERTTQFQFMLPVSKALAIRRSTLFLRKGL